MVRRLEKSEYFGWLLREQQIPPLRIAPVGMTGYPWCSDRNEASVVSNSSNRNELLRSAQVGEERRVIARVHLHPVFV
jgi:hypothetical protein